MSKRSKADVKYAIDLLWTHQVRRENASLHKEIEHLREEVKTAHPAEIDWIRQTTFAAQKRAEESSSAIRKTEKIQHDLASTVNDAAKRIDDVTRRSDSLGPRIDRIERSGEQSVAKLTSTVQQLNAKAMTLEQQHRQTLSSIGDEIAGLKQHLASKIASDKLQALERKVDGLQAELKKAQESQQSPGIVIDSIEQATGLHGVDHGSNMNGHANLPPKSISTALPTEQAKLPAFLHSPARSMAPPPSERPNNEDSLVEEDMLTLQPKDPALTPGVSDDVDLDENVNTMSYASKMNGRMDTNVQDSLPMLPLQPRIPPVTFSDVLSLKQGRFHSWDRYFAEGEDLFRRLPREREFSVVKAFREGLYDVNQRRQCQQWLESNGWMWASIASFARSSTLAVGGYTNREELESGTTRVPSPTKVHFNVPERPDQAPQPAQGTRTKTKRVRTQSQPTAGSQEPRRSQRIAESANAAQKDVQLARAKLAPTLEKALLTMNRPASQRNKSKTRRLTDLQRQGASERDTLQPADNRDHAASQGPISGALSEIRDKANHDQVTDYHVPKRRQPAKMSSRTKESSRQQAQRKGKAPNAPALSGRPSKPPVSGQKQLPEISSTPVRQRTPSPFRSIQPNPRLVKRKRATSDTQQQSDEEMFLPRVPYKPAKGSKPPPKKSRLPLPPPPAIPILPTSED